MSIEKWESILKALPIVANTPKGNMNTTRINEPKEVAEHLERLEGAGVIPEVRKDHIYVLQTSGTTAEYQNRYYHTAENKWIHVLDAYYSD